MPSGTLAGGRAPYPLAQRHVEVLVDQSGRPKGELRRPAEPAVRLAQAGLPGRILGRLIEVGFLDRSVILAGQAFSAILPLIMVISAISPQSGGDSPTAILARRLGLKPSDVASLQAAIAPPPSARASIGVLSVLLALLTATASPVPCIAATNWPGGCRPSGCGPPGARWPW